MQNCYFPLFIPLANFTREAEHVEGFAKEMAVVTHHRLISDGKGGLIPDPAAKLEKSRWWCARRLKQSSAMPWRAGCSRGAICPLLTNQWANVVRWEMRTRMFLAHQRISLAGRPHRARKPRAGAGRTHRALEM